MINTFSGEFFSQQKYTINPQNTPLSALEIARSYQQRGFQPLPIPFKSKKATLPNWTNFQTTDADLPNYFNGTPQNVGVLLGKTSNWLVDIDLDAPESLRIAHLFLPETKSVFGRTSKPKSHYLYISPNAETVKFSGKEMVVELRSTGCQTVFPNSTHESGEIITWYEDGEPLVIDFDTLRCQVAKLASAVLLAGHWTDGNRHEPTLALSGALYRQGWKENEIRQFVEAICIAANDDDITDRLNCVSSTIEKLADGENDATGFPKLAELIGEETVKILCKWLEIKFEKPKQSKGEKQAARLIQLAEQQQIELFHTPENQTYARVAVNNHYETVNLNSSAFRQWLEHSFWKAENGTASKTAFDEAISNLKARAKFDSPQWEIFLRVAEHNGEIYLDLTNETWQVAKITSSGWQIIEAKDCPVMFQRIDGMLPLPIPKRGKNIAKLKQYINVSNETFPLVLGWLVACLNPNIPYPILVLQGEQGSAKSTTAEFLRALIDPHKVPSNANPRDEQEILNTANNSLILSYDNLSFVKGDLSDTLCRIATGVGMRKRKLYSDGDEFIITVRRPIMLNGITELFSRADTLDRSLLIECPHIPKTRRQQKNTLENEFEAARPFLLGALLDAVAVALREKPNVKLTDLERMADFQVWACAAESSFGLAKGEFNKMYLLNRKQAHGVAEESNPIIGLIQAFVERQNEWEGTATELFQILNDFLIANLSLRQKLGGSGNILPKIPSQLSKALARVTPNLREKGIEFLRDKSGKRSISLRKLCVNVQDAEIQSSAKIIKSIVDSELLDYAYQLFGNPEQQEAHWVC